MKKLFILFIIFGFKSNAQLTYVPDDNFEAYIETTYPLASDGNINNNYVKTAFISTVNLVMPTSYQISDFTGLLAFNSLKYLNLNNHTMSSLDLTNLNHAPNLEINISNCNNLSLLKLPGGSMDFCVIEANAFLKTASFKTGCNIRDLWIKGNNMLDSINISQNGYLLGGAYLNIRNNPVLSYFNMANGYCANWPNVTFMGNPSLKCIIVDNPTFSNNASWYWDYKSMNPTVYKYISTSSSCNPVGLEEYKIVIFAKISPNPSIGQFIFNGLIEYCSIEVTDLTGRVFYKDQLDESKNSINLEGMPSGLYLYKLKNKQNQVQQGKLVLD